MWARFYFACLYTFHPNALLFYFLTFSPSDLFVRCLILSALCLSHFVTCQTKWALMFVRAQLHLRQQQSGAFCLLLKPSQWTSSEKVSPFGKVSGFLVIGVGEWGHRPVGVPSKGAPQWPGQRELTERGAYRSAAHWLGGGVLHVAQGGKGNGLAQLNASFVFIKRMGMLVLAVRQDA